jgi:S1-C subfamily serine protease
MRVRHVLASTLLCLAALPAQGKVNGSLLRAPEDDPAAAAARRSLPALVVQKVRPAVVHVVVEVDGPRGVFEIERASSGVIVDASGLVVTWHHLVREAQEADDKRLSVQLDDAENTRLPAAVVRVDDATGLVLLHVEPPAGSLAFAPLGADRPMAGESAVVMARPEGKEMLAFAGVASPALSAVTLSGRTLRAEDVFLCDSRNDERCEGAPVFDGDGRLLGLYAAEHVQRDKSEPTLEDLKKPSFGFVVPAAVIRRAFAREFGAAIATNAALAKEPARLASATADAVRRVAPSVVGVWAGHGDWPQVGPEDPGAVQRIAGLGSGVVLSKTGLVVANLHVCQAGSPRIRAGGSTFPAKVVKSNAASNLALLQAELPAGVELQAADCNPDDDAILGARRSSSAPASSPRVAIARAAASRPTRTSATRTVAAPSPTSWGACWASATPARSIRSRWRSPCAAIA